MVMMSPVRSGCCAGPGLALRQCLRGGASSHGRGCSVRCAVVAHQILPAQVGADAAADGAFEREVLPQREAFEVVGGEEPAQVGMTGEDDAEHLPGLPFVEARRRPQARDRRQRLPFGQSGLHPQAVAVGVGEQMGHDREGRVGDVRADGRQGGCPVGRTPSTASSRQKVSTSSQAAGSTLSVSSPRNSIRSRIRSPKVDGQRVRRGEQRCGRRELSSPAYALCPSGRAASWRAHPRARSAARASRSRAGIRRRPS